MFRYWDGRAWSAATTNNAQSAPPAGALGQTSQYGQTSQGQYGRTGEYGPTGYGGQTAPGKPKGGRAGWWIVAIVLGLVVILAAVFGVRALLGRSGIINPGDPGGSSTREICPQQQTETPGPQPNDGRVHGGQLSYPQLGSPWAAPIPEDRVPFGRDVLTQTVTVEPDYDGPGRHWVASVLIGQLVAGDGFFTPQEGSEIVVKCIVGTFYGTDTQVNRDDKKSEALKVDGKDAWVVESHLTFDIPNLKTKGELLIVVIVATSPEASSIYYASIPDTTPELVQPARNAMKGLKVDG